MTVSEYRSKQAGQTFTRLANNATTTSQALGDSGLSFPVIANEVCEFEFTLRIGSTGTAGMKLALTFPNGATLTAVVRANSNSVTALIADLITASATSGATIMTIASQNGTATIRGCIVNGVNAGNVSLQFLKVTSGTATIAANSFVTAKRIG